MKSKNNAYVSITNSSYYEMCCNEEECYDVK